MGYFAVTSENKNLEITACHLNLWCLPIRFSGNLGSLGSTWHHNWKALRRIFPGKLPKRKSVFFDVGLRIKVISGSDLTLKLILPFQTSDKGFTDLSACVLDSDTARLIFGRDVTVLAGSKIDYEGASVHEKRITEEVIPQSMLDIVRVADESNEGFSTWKVHLRRAVTADEALYLRLRFGVVACGHLVENRGWGLAKRGYTIDFRACDARETANGPPWEKTRTAIVPIQKINFFLVTSYEYVPRFLSPDVYYCRVLEHNSWDKYINAMQPAGNCGKLLIHQWRGPVSSVRSSNIDQNEPPISPNRPFRVFVDLYKDFGKSIWLTYVLAGTIGALLPRVFSFLYGLMFS